MSVEAADLSRWVLRSTEAELCDCLEVPEKTGDSCHTKSGGQGSPGCCGCSRNEITNVQGTSQLDGAIGHRVRQSPLCELCRVRWCRSGTINDEPVAHRMEVGPHLGRPFPVVCPIKDGDIGGDGRVCLVVRHYENKGGQLLVLLQCRDGLRYCRNIVLSTY